MSKKRLAAAFFLLILSQLALAEEKKGSAVNTKCLECHSSQAALDDKLKINEKSFFSSVHKDLGCTDCHQVVLGEPEGKAPHKKNIPDPDCTAVCHREDKKPRPGLDPLLYKDSVHGRAYLERGVRDVAKCWDCHGKHNIRKAEDPDSTVNRKNIPLTCSTCHADMAVVGKYHIHSETPYQEYMQSVHGKALFEKGLVSFAAVCTDCHGVHEIKGVGEPSLQAKRPETCGKCHQLIFEEYKDSIHGQEALKGNTDVPLCVDCHGEHKIASPKDAASPTYSKNIPETCSGCHAKPEIMKKYGVPQDRIETFIESMHGIAIGFGYKAVANCSSCHGVHDIRPAADPRSRVNPANLHQTCGQANCHPGIPENIAKAKIHIGPEQRRPRALYIVQKTLLIIVMITIAITVLWFIPGFIKKIKLVGKKKR